MMRIRKEELGDIKIATVFFSNSKSIVRTRRQDAANDAALLITPF